MTCCLIRRKVLVTVAAILPEEHCGVPDSALADVMRFDLDASSGNPVIGFLYCPWCGTPRKQGDETIITDNAPPDKSGEEWKEDPSGSEP